MQYKPPTFYHTNVKTRYLNMLTGINITHQGLIPINIHKRLELIREDLDICKNVKSVGDSLLKNKKLTVQELVKRKEVRQFRASLQNSQPSSINILDLGIQTLGVMGNVSHVNCKSTLKNVMPVTTGPSGIQKQDSTKKTSTSNASTVTNTSEATVRGTLKVFASSMVMLFSMKLMNFANRILNGRANGLEKKSKSIRKKQRN